MAKDTQKRDNPPSDREARLAAALRANLRRRKAAAQTAPAGTRPDGPDADGSPTPDDKGTAGGASGSAE